MRQGQRTQTTSLWPSSWLTRARACVSQGQRQLGGRRQEAAGYAGRRPAARGKRAAGLQACARLHLRPLLSRSQRATAASCATPSGRLGAGAAGARCFARCFRPLLAPVLCSCALLLCNPALLLHYAHRHAATPHSRTVRLKGHLRVLLGHHVSHHRYASVLLTPQAHEPRRSRGGRGHTCYCARALQKTAHALQKTRAQDTSHDTSTRGREGGREGGRWG